MRCSFTFSWSAAYVGLFWSRYYRNLYVHPIPFLGIRIHFRRPVDLTGLEVIDPLDEFGVPDWSSM